MPKIREPLLNLQGFQYATPLDLNMGYYHIRLIEQASNLCTIILPEGKYQYKRLPMGVSNSLEDFQQKMNKTFHGFEYIQAYINNLLIINKVDWGNHLEKLELTLKNLKDSGIKCNIKSHSLNKVKSSIQVSGLLGMGSDQQI